MLGSSSDRRRPDDTASADLSLSRDSGREPESQERCSAPEPAFAVELVLDGHYAVVLLEGRLEQAGCTLLQEKLARALAARYPAWLVTDVSALEFADSFGLAVLLGADRHARASGGRMIVSGAGDTLRALLARRGLDAVFEMRATVGEAIADLYLGR
ncbi:STAS domain-containing protein [Streptosporangium sp. OZ121]|uniref:STAS domain-containing protein n=1 Tax=Streptosporangium sp. OZ121 TaxID=3444183 RepID=UPI003F79B6F4